jgi:hypothetical protein
LRRCFTIFFRYLASSICRFSCATCRMQDDGHSNVSNVWILLQSLQLKKHNTSKNCADWNNSRYIEYIHNV